MYILLTYNSVFVHSMTSLADGTITGQIANLSDQVDDLTSAVNTVVMALEKDMSEMNTFLKGKIKQVSEAETNAVSGSNKWSITSRPKSDAQYSAYLPTFKIHFPRFKV